MARIDHCCIGRDGIGGYHLRVGYRVDMECNKYFIGLFFFIFYDLVVGRFLEVTPCGGDRTAGGM